jgi:hypothetical protein
MSLRFTCIACVVALSFSLPVAAQSPLDAETLSQARDGESESLDLQSIRRYGDVLGMFHVNIVWADTGRPSPEDYLARRVRYAVNCEEGTLTLAAVGLFDRNGQLQKTLVVPPGASDPVKPAKGTQQAKWVQRVCMF